MRQLLRRAWCLLRHRQLERDLSEELDFHRAMKQRELQDAGATPLDAAVATRRALGSTALAGNHARDVWIWPWLQDLSQDVRFAVRLLAKDRSVTVTIVLVLALGIGASNTIFTIANGAILRGLPVPDAERIVVVNDVSRLPLNVSYREFQEWRAPARASFTDLAAHAGIVSMNIGDQDLAPASVTGTYLSAHTFDLLGVNPILGRSFRSEDDEQGAPSVVLIGHRLWTSRYATDASIVGRAIRVNGMPAIVVGVMPEGFQFPYNHDLWRPLASLPGLLTERRDLPILQVFGRLAARTTIPQAQATLTVIAERVSRDHPGPSRAPRLTVGPFTGTLRPNDPWVPLLGATGFILLIGCANVANLILVRGARRSREIAVRVSIGASRWRIVRQLFTEHLVLAILAAIAGLGLSILGIRLWVVSIPAVPWPYWWTWTMDARVFQFLASISLGTALVFGVGPALHISKTNVNECLKDGGRGATAGPGARRWTSALLTTELALTLVLLAGAGLSIRTFLVLYRVDAIVDTSNAAIGLLRLPAQKYPTPEQRMTFFASLQERLAAVSSVTTSSAMPFIGAPSWRLSIAGRPDAADDTPPAVSYVVIGPRYFETLGVTLVRGRPFGHLDGAPGHEVAIVNQRFVAMHFPDREPIGQRIRLTSPVTSGQSPPWATIIGISPTIRRQMAQELDPVAYVPYRQDPGSVAWLIARAPINPEGLIALLREHLRSLDPDLPLGYVMSLDDDLLATRFTNRILLTMFLVFAGIALLLCVVGLYAVTANAVTQRTQEIGVRMALGARTGQVVWPFVARALTPLTVGLVFGIGGVFGLARLIQSFLIQTSATDVVTLASVAGLLVIVAVAACVIPARRAARLDPVRALRYE